MSGCEGRTIEDNMVFCCSFELFFCPMLDGLGVLLLFHGKKNKWRAKNQFFHIFFVFLTCFSKGSGGFYTLFSNIVAVFRIFDIPWFWAFFCLFFASLSCLVLRENPFFQTFS